MVDIIKKLTQRPSSPLPIPIKDKLGNVTNPLPKSSLDNKTEVIYNKGPSSYRGGGNKKSSNNQPQQSNNIIDVIEASKEPVVQEQSKAPSISEVINKTPNNNLAVNLVNQGYGGVYTSEGKFFPTTSPDFIPKGYEKAYGDIVGEQVYLVPENQVDRTISTAQGPGIIQSPEEIAKDMQRENIDKLKVQFNKKYPQGLTGNNFNQYTRDLSKIKEEERVYNSIGKDISEVPKSNLITLKDIDIKSTLSGRQPELGKRRAQDYAEQQLRRFFNTANREVAKVLPDNLLINKLIPQIPSSRESLNALNRIPVNQNIIDIVKLGAFEPGAITEGLAGSTAALKSGGRNIVETTTKRVVKPVVKSSEIELSDAIKVGKNAAGEDVWVVNTRVNTIRVTPSGKPVDKIITLGKSYVVTSETANGAIEATSETIANSIGRGGSRVYKNPLKVTQKFDVAQAKGSVILEQADEVLKGTGKSNIKEIGVLRLKKNGEVLQAQLRKIINPREYRALTNVISKPVYEKEAIRTVGRVKLEGVESGAKSGSISEISPTRLKVKGYTRAEKLVRVKSLEPRGSILKVKKVLPEKRVRTYTRKPGVEPKGSLIKTGSFGKSFTPRQAEIDITDLEFPNQNNINLLTKTKSKGQAALAVAKAQTSEIAKTRALRPVVTNKKVTTFQDFKDLRKPISPKIKTPQIEIKQEQAKNVPSVRQSAYYGKGTYERTESVSLNVPKAFSNSGQGSFSKGRSLSNLKSQEVIRTIENEKVETNLRQPVRLSDLSKTSQNNRQKELQRQNQLNRLNQREAVRQSLRTNLRVRERTSPKIKVQIEPRIKLPPLKIEVNDNKKKAFGKSNRGGFTPVIKRDGKFVRVSSKSFSSREEAFGIGFTNTRSNLKQSVAVIRTNEPSIRSSSARAAFNKLQGEFRPSKQYGKSVLVEKNPLKRREEIIKIQEARRLQSPFRRVGAPKLRSIK